MLKLGSRNYSSIFLVCSILYNNRRELSNGDPPQQTSPECCRNNAGLVLYLRKAQGSDQVLPEQSELQLLQLNDTGESLVLDIFLLRQSEQKSKLMSHSYPANPDWLCSKTAELFSVFAKVGLVPAHWNCQQQKAMKNWPSSLLSPAAPMGLIYFCKLVNFWQWGTW